MKRILENFAAACVVGLILYGMYTGIRHDLEFDHQERVRLSQIHPDCQ